MIQMLKKIELIDTVPLIIFVLFPLTFFNIENPDFQIYLWITSFVSINNLFP
jgi:hypothetical protein